MFFSISLVIPLPLPQNITTSIAGVSHNITLLMKIKDFSTISEKDDFEADNLSKSP